MRQTGKLIMLAAVAWLNADESTAQEPAALKPLNDWAAKVRPEIERLLGYAVPAPALEVAGRKPDTMIRDLQAHLRWRFPHLDQRAYGVALADAFEVSKQAALVQFVEGTSTLLVYPERAAAMARWHEALKSADSVALYKLAMIHEMTRQALNARYQWSKRRDGCADGEEWLALQAVVEG